MKKIICWGKISSSFTSIRVKHVIYQDKDSTHLQDNQMADLQTQELHKFNQICDVA